MPVIDPESPEGQLLVNIILQRLSSAQLEVAAEDVAKYVTIMICNGKSAETITEELNDMFGNNFPDGFAMWACQMAEQVATGQISGLDDAEMLETPSVSFSADQPDRSGTLFNRANRKSDKNIHKSSSGISKNTNKLASRLSKNFVSDPVKSMALAAGMQADQTMEKDNVISDQRFPGEIRINVHNKQRCRHWPNCNLRGCKFGHPSALCRFGPLCQMIRGTCPYLHEDDMANGFVPRNMMPFAVPASIQPMEMTNFRGVADMIAQPTQQRAAPLVQICKYKEKCVNKDCPFGHATPVNPDAVVLDFDWCAAKEKCENADCSKMHPSMSLVKKPEPMEMPNYLDACKFGSRCTNFRCKYRHATSTVLCRNGSECSRPDCSFSHPLSESCKFGKNCVNRHCLYQHDAERDAVLANGGPRMTWKREEPQPIEGGA